VKNRIGLKDLWYKLPLNQITSVPKTVIKSLNKLVTKCEFEDNSVPWIKNIYFLEVKYREFEDCYRKIYTTIKGLSAKEVWINSIGGSNQITLSLFLASCLTGVPTKFIYLFQDEKKIHPDIDKPNFKNPQLEIPPESWYELPFFWLGILNDILKRIEIECFSGKKTTNLSQIKAVLNSSDLSSQFIAKLQSANIIRIDNEDPNKVYKGPGFETMKKYELEPDVSNFSDWKQWAREKEILYRVDFDQNFQLRQIK
jgi:hypothetical protein